MEILHFEEVYKSYAHFGHAIKNVNFTLNEGDFAALAGPSGSGKTTILHLASGIDQPSDGEITLLNQKINELKRHQLLALRRKGVGFVFQAYNLFPVLTAYENVEFPLALDRVDAATRRKKIHAVLEEVGLEKVMHHFPSELSGGQQQRVAIARAIVTNPLIIFADEPTANLDSKTSEHLLTLFKSLNESRKITFLFSSHDPRVLKLSDRIFNVQDGELSIGKE